MKRLLVFGVDGATWRLMSPLMESEALPNFSRLAESGVRGQLSTLEPTVSPAIWTTIATGVLPGRHGILGFDGVPGMSMKTLPNATMRNVKAYWNILSDFQRTTATVGWWATWPVDDLREGSCMVSDRVPYTRMEAAIQLDSLTPQDVYPDSLLEELAPLIERPDDISADAVERFLRMDRDEMEARLLAAEYQMGNYLPEFKFTYQADLTTQKLALKLLGEQPVDTAAVYYTGVDTVSHLYWHFTYPSEFPNFRIEREDIEKFGMVIPMYYELMDRYLGELLEVMGEDTTVLVVSDHGFGGTGNLPWSGGHGRITPGAPIAPPGVLILAGPGIATTGDILTGASVLDVTPTILYLMGLPAAADMPGRVLIEAMAPGSPPELAHIASYETVGTRRLPRETQIDPAGDAERIERLRQLGYIQ